MKENAYSYIFVMAIVTFLIRVLPMTIFRKEIKNTFLQSFLYYIPYVTLSVMTFPAIIDVTDSYVSASFALLFGILMAWTGAGLFKVSATCCATVFLLEFFFV